MWAYAYERMVLARRQGIRYEKLTQKNSHERNMMKSDEATSVVSFRYRHSGANT